MKMARILLNHYSQRAPQGAKNSKIALERGSMTVHEDSAREADFRFQHDAETGCVRHFEAGSAKKGE
jgi:hypothetical protein